MRRVPAVLVVRRDEALRHLRRALPKSELCQDRPEGRAFRRVWVAARHHEPREGGGHPGEVGKRVGRLLLRLLSCVMLVYFGIALACIVVVTFRVFEPARRGRRAADGPPVVFHHATDHSHRLLRRLGFAVVLPPALREEQNQVVLHGQCEQQDAETVHVRRLVVTLAAHHLWGREQRSPHGGHGCCCCCLAFAAFLFAATAHRAACRGFRRHRPGGAEVRDFRRQEVGDEHVVRFQVAVQNAVAFKRG
mmetsp:Transcript_81921/g.163621  ORF Transcript_81921/g.163621 Transcript_81921/m.163621 type:complete len:249 (-) Transcript_81921:560-1306(-)